MVRGSSATLARSAPGAIDAARLYRHLAGTAAHLHSLGVRGRIAVEQGFEIGRPSRLYLDVAETIRVGGKVRPVLTCRFDF